MKGIHYFVVLVFLSNFSLAVAPKFDKSWIEIGGKKLEVEIADSQEKAAYGLMYRRSLKENEGMLFVFPSPQPLSFWMKNTFVDLSVAYFSESKILSEIIDMKAAKSEMQSHFETYPSSELAQYALEMRLGWFTKNKIKVGDKLKILTKK